MELSRESMMNQTNFSLTIVKHLFSKRSNNNIVFSPLSIQVILSIIAVGSDGPTQQQLLDFLCSKSIDQLNSFASHLVSVVLKDASPSGGPCLSVANGVWVEQTLSLQPVFQKIVSSDFKAKLASVDFRKKAVEVTNKVNLWAEKETNGLIKDILPERSVNEFTRLIFTNALYFKGEWNQKFKASKTKDYDFHLLNGSSVKVPFMTSMKGQYIGAFDGFKVLRLPYKKGQDDRRFSMYFILPDAKDGLTALVEKVASESELLHHIQHYLSKEKVGDFKIPKFNVSFGFETSDMMKELGVVLPFSPGGLTKMVNSLAGQDLFVSHIFQKSFIKVNEEGTEAAATTSGFVEARGKSRRPRLDFVADHPFLFLIREDLSGTILFLGQVLNPLVG